jgi:rare lipoprotein A
MLLLLSLAACSSVSERDSAPQRVPDVSQVPDAVPRDEPRSKYGNPRKYTVFGKTYYTMASAAGYREKGIASWYGTKFHGRKTSSGEVYDMYAMTAAHKTLPLPTYVEVTNLSNGRRVIVKVNDRGPFHGNRIIDLSYSAATKLGIIANGTGMVEVRALTPGEPEPVIAQPVNNVVPVTTQTAELFLQVGAFSTQNRAEQVKNKVTSHVSGEVLVVPFVKPSGQLYRVRVPLTSVAEGDQLAKHLESLGFFDVHIVVE